MLSARQLLLMRRARDRAIGIAIAPLGTVVLLPDPDFRRRVFGCVSHIGLSCVAGKIGRMDGVVSVVRWKDGRSGGWGAGGRGGGGGGPGPPPPPKKPEAPPPFHVRPGTGIPCRAKLAF